MIAKDKLLRAVALTVLVMVVLTAALLSAAPMLVDRAALRERLAAEATAALSLPVQIDAITGLTLLPRPQIVLGSVRILATAATTTPTHAPTLASAETVRLDLTLPALLTGHAEPALLRAEGIALRPLSRARRAASPWLAALELPGVSGAELTLSYPAGAKRLRWPLWTQAGGAPSSAGTGPIAVSARLPLDAADGRIAGTFRFTARVDTTALPVLTLAPLRLSAADLRLGGLRDLAPVLAAERAQRNADGVWHISEFWLSEAEPPADPPADLDLRGDWVIGPAGGLVRGSLRLAPLDLRRWLARHLEQPVPGAPGGLRCFAFAGGFERVGDRLDVAPLALRLDATRARAAGSVGLGPAPTAAVVLRLDRLDLDRYLTASGAADAGAPGAAADDCMPVSEAALPGPADPSPVQPAPAQPDLPALPTGPHAPDLVLALGAESLRVGALAYHDLGIRAVKRDRRTGMDITAGAFYGGTLEARIERTLRPAAPPWQTLQAEVTGADLGALLTDLQGVPQATGRVHLVAALAAAGSDAAALRRGLSGSLRLRVQDGRLTALDQAAASFGPLLSVIGLEVTPDSLAFSRLSLSADGEDGVFRSRDIDARARLFALAGDGALDLSAQRLDADLVATLVQPPDGPDVRDLAGIEVPVQLSGAIDAPDVAVELGPAVAEAARRAARRELGGDDNVLKQLEDATGVQGLEQGLRNLFGL
ncbi:AsmA-like C-terminal region-containing protein [uncultured Thiohalocapsa sp.]|uniref:AsmA family protein n=1 Tax=uncultured Thiohalocapsa sp. TaxID=768990 RepID=UPI0025EA4626|nr:AsmA-like C-terminal region-containing protein [uncultured Thiohalocapsa sp.]